MASYSTYSDEVLVTLLRQDDEGAFTEIYCRYWKPLLHTAHAILQDKEIVRDIVQTIFITFWQRRKEVQVDNLAAYLQQAARFSVFKAIRQQEKNKDFYSRLAQVTSSIIADDRLLFREQQELLRTLLGSLPDDCREVFRLSREENMTYKQIAGMLGVSEKTVEKKISRSLRHIRSGLVRSLFVVVALLGCL